MKISKSACYAIAACAQLSHDGPPIPCSQLAQLGDMPDRFLLQVMNNLAKDDIVASTRGVQGGYRLSRPRTQITLLEIVEAADGPLDIDVIDDIDGLGASSNRVLKEALAKSTKYFRSSLNELRLTAMKVEHARELAAAG